MSGSNVFAIVLFCRWLYMAALLCSVRLKWLSIIHISSSVFGFFLSCFCSILLCSVLFGCFALLCFGFVYFVLFLALLRPCHFPADLPLGSRTDAQGCQWECPNLGLLCAPAVGGGPLRCRFPVSGVSAGRGIAPGKLGWAPCGPRPKGRGPQGAVLVWCVCPGVCAGAGHAGSLCCVATPLYFASEVRHHGTTFRAMLWRNGEGYLRTHMAAAILLGSLEASPWFVQENRYWHSLKWGWSTIILHLF